MSANDMWLIDEGKGEVFMIYHIDIDEYAASGKRGRPYAKVAGLREAIQWANEEYAEYGYVIKLRGTPRPYHKGKG